MLNLPKSTEVHKQLPKKSIYEKFKLNVSEKEKIDADISKIRIVNEISPVKVHIAEGEKVKAFFVVQVILKSKEFDVKTIVMISKLIPQNMLFVLEYNDESKLAVYHTNLMQTSWQPKESSSVSLKGTNLDIVWENIITEIGGIKIENNNTLDEQIEIDIKRKKLEKEIDILDKRARKQKQPKKKFELSQQISRLRKELEEI